MARRPAGPPRPSVAPSRAPARPSATARQRGGELAIIVRPWALAWLDGKPLGQTPFRGKLAAGRYTVRIANDVAGKDETATITVRADQITTLQRSW